MRLVLAPQEFKGSLSAVEAAAAMAIGVRRALPDAEIDEIPLSDGGPGLVDALVTARHGALRRAPTVDPLGRPIEAAFGLIDGGRTAVIEIAAASGLSLLKRGELDPLHANTYGSGILIRAALDAGARAFIVGLGGSATNDGGAGLITALGGRMLDADGQEIAHGGAALLALANLDLTKLDARLAESRFLVACDVTNPLCGPEGASAVYGSQKGATPDMVATLDRALERLAAVIHNELGMDVKDAPGAGAAGGLGAGLMAFLNAELRSGFDLVAEATRLRERIGAAQLVLTGEGCLDGQTAFGKVATGVARAAKPYEVPVLALAGSLGEGYERALTSGIAAAFSIVPGPTTLEDAHAHAAEYLAARSEAAVNAVLAGRFR